MFRKLNSFLPNFNQSLIILALTILAGSLISILATFAINLIVPSFEPYSQLVLYPLLFLPAAVYIYSIIISRHFTEDATVSTAKTAVPINRPNFGRIGGVLSFVLFIILIFAFNIISEPLSSWMGVPDFIKALMAQMKENPISTFITVVVLAPLFEELLCRGIILRGLLQYFSPWKAILLSAGMFAVMHMNPWQAIPAFLTGGLMGWIYYRTRSLWAVIFIHFINNGFSFALTVFFPELPDDVTFASIIPDNYYYLTFVIALLITAAIIYTMNQRYDKPLSDKI